MLVGRLILCIAVLLNVQCTMQAQDQSCLFRNPLCFYSTDILSYLQILYKNSRYEEMIPFLYEPKVLQKIGKDKALNAISMMNFGYEFRRVGIKEEKKGQIWLITYQRIRIGTSETFTIRCQNVNDTTRLLMSSNQRKTVFHPKRP
ncbi:MAG: hypothetical protein ACKO0Y_12165 [Bacteroidota bacterium]